MPAVSFWNRFAALTWGNTYIKGLPGKPSGKIKNVNMTNLTSNRTVGLCNLVLTLSNKIVKRNLSTRIVATSFEMTPIQLTPTPQLPS
jgi:hypothetical protein